MQRNDPVIRIAALCGSLRPGSYTRRALAIALDGAHELGATTSIIDLNDYDLPFVAGMDESGYSADVFRLRDDVRQAHGIVIGTPEYHGSYTGVLKNALDLMGFHQFEGKVVGLVGVSGGKLGGIGALDSLRTVGRSLHAWVIPDQVGIPQARLQFNTDGELTDDVLRSRLLDLGRQMARFAFLLTSERAMEFLREWERIVDNPGGVK